MPIRRQTVVEVESSSTFTLQLQQSPTVDFQRQILHDVEGQIRKIYFI